MFCTNKLKETGFLTYYILAGRELKACSEGSYKGSPAERGIDNPKLLVLIY
jgi:hypothetical protein